MANRFEKNNDFLPLYDLLFDQKYWFFKHHYESYHHFIEEIVDLEFKDNLHIFHEDYIRESVYINRFEFSNIMLRPPTYKNELMFPEHARLNKLTYAGDLLCDVKQLQIVRNLVTGEENVREIGVEKSFLISTIPIMVKSKWCSTIRRKDLKNTECKYDPGGYFIVGGNEKVIICQERICDNKPMVFMKKEANYKNGVMFYVQVQSRMNDFSSLPQTVVIKMEKDNSLTLTSSHFKNVPLYILLKALGISTEREIEQYITFSENDPEMSNVLYFSLKKARINIKGDPSNVHFIKTQDEAQQYINEKCLKHKKMYSETDLELKAIQQKKYLVKIMTYDLLPHIQSNMKMKAYYICLMAHKLLNCFLGRQNIDDRDSHINKRIDTPGVLLGQLFKQHLKKIINDAGSYFKKKNTDATNPANIIQKIKGDKIGQGIKSALLTGTWGMNKTRTGVAQVLSRNSFHQALAYLRRINTPNMDPSTNKIVSVRHLHPGHYGFFAVEESPEGHNVGITKHLASTASITNSAPSQIKIIKQLIPFIELQIVHPSLFNVHTKLFINGSWIGLTDDPVNYVNTFNEFRKSNKIKKECSIVFNVDTNEIKMYCDGGRLYRPLLTVSQNLLNLTVDMLNHININDKENTNFITKWSELLLKYPDVIDYVDIESSENIMVASEISKLYENYDKFMKLVKNPKRIGDPNNRYDDSIFVRFTHMEIHPTAMMGIIGWNASFNNHNAVLRALYNFSQARQPLQYYCTNYRYRMDISYLLYNPQVPIVHTKTMKYTGIDNMPYGENAIVAVMCYSGYNQEDSVIMNQSSLDRGMFRSTNLKVYEEKIQKNHTSALNDQFTKPSPDMVVSMRKANYSKLNELGYVPEETHIYKDDIIIGKISPIQTTDKNKSFKDNSKVYNNHVPGVVNKFVPIVNEEGYDIYRMQIRSERMPVVGDKMCLTSDHDVLTNRGWIPIAEVTMNDKVACLKEGLIMEYQHPLDIIHKQHNGTLYEIESNQVSLRVTSDHDMFVAPERGDHIYKKIPAIKLYGKKRRYLKNCEGYDPGVVKHPNLLVENGKITHFVLPEYNSRNCHKDEKHIPIDAWIQFYGIWMAEGCCSDGRIAIASHKKRVRDILDPVMIEMNYRPSYNFSEKYNANITYRIGCVQLAEYMRPISVGAINKQLDDWVWLLDRDQARLLMESMMLGDGDYMPYTSKGEEEKHATTMRYYTSSIKLRDDVTRLCLHAGWSGNYLLKQEAGTAYKITETNKGFTNADYWCITVVRKQNNPLVNKNIRKDGENRHDSLTKYTGMVYCLTLPNLGVFYVRRNSRVVWTGNCTVNAQKGVVGTTLRRVDMPFTKTGLQPNIIINPNCIPSRMTLGLILEQLYAKRCAIYGEFGDGSSFNYTNFEEVCDELEKAGFDKYGREKLYCGITGKEIEVMIFMNPQYYMRLKHLTNDKIHSRSMGPVQMLTRTALEGRSKDGGLRIGEMERDAILAHGAAQYLKEAFMEKADKYSFYVCTICGQFAEKLLKRNNWRCRACNNTTDIALIQIPYCFKLLCQELQSVNIYPQINIKTDKYFDGL